MDWESASSKIVLGNKEFAFMRIIETWIDKISFAQKWFPLKQIRRGGEVLEAWAFSQSVMLRRH